MFHLKQASLTGAIIVLFVVHSSLGLNKYSEEANKSGAKKTKSQFSLPNDVKELRSIEKPFRMHKLNMVWTKARNVSFVIRVYQQKFVKIRFIFILFYFI